MNEVRASVTGSREFSELDLGAIRIAAIIPCFNEENAIGKVVQDLKTVLPSAEIYVFDNNSTDETVEVAEANGAIVRRERRQGKGHVVRRMFADVEADIYVMLDGDDTYDSSVAPEMVRLLLSENLDMVNGARDHDDDKAYRSGHAFGNRLLTSLVYVLFGRQFTDMLSGYRVFSRRFVKSFPFTAGGFEIETELTVHALALSMPTAEVSTPYKARAEGTESKLRTYSDGARIFWMIFNLLKQERPMLTFGLAGTALIAASLLLAYPVVITYLESGLVPRFPTAILATGMSILGFLSFTCGLILDTVTRGRLETKRMFYLAKPSPQAAFVEKKSSS